MAEEVKINIKTTADNRAVDSTGKALDEVSSAAGKAGNEGEKAGKKTGASWAGASLSVIKAINPVKLLGAELRYLRNAALAGGAALAVAVREGIKLNVPLSQTVNMFSGNKLANFAKFRAEILDLSSTTGIATADITKALYQAGSAQMAPDQAFTAIRKAIQGVVADGGTIPDVLGGIIAGMKSFGGDVDQTAEKLYRIVQLGQTTFAEVGGYLNTVGSTAAANGVSLDEVGGAMAQLTSKTIPTSTAFIQLSNIMGRLNNILGDNWHDTRTLQDAMEEVAKSTGYSQSKMQELFGIESNRVIQAMVGENFQEAKRQLGEFKGQLTGLADAAKFSDQFRGFAKIWESLRNYVTEIGSAIETRWAPRIQFIAAKIAEMRQGEGWQQLIDTIAAKLEATVTWAIVQVKTAADLITHLRSQDFGLARMAEVAKTIVVELITLAVTLLMSLLKANLSVFIALVKIIAAAFKKEIFDVMKSVGLGGRVANESVKKLNTLDANQKNELAQSLGFTNAREMGGSKAYTSGDLDASIAAFESSEGVVSAISQSAASLKAAMADVDAQWQESKANIKASAGQASGGTFNWDAEAAENRAEVNDFMTPAAAPLPSLPSRRVAPRKSRAQLMQELEELQMRQTEAQMDQAYAAGQTPQEQRLAQWQQRNRGRNLSSQSFEAQEGNTLSQAATKSREQANQAAQEAAATLASISNMMATLVSGLKDLEGQIKNQP